MSLRKRKRTRIDEDEEEDIQVRFRHSWAMARHNKFFIKIISSIQKALGISIR